MMRKVLIFGVLLFLSLGLEVKGQTPLAEQMALTAMDKLFKNETFVNDKKGPKWTYDMGVVMEGIAEVWRTTGNGEYFRYMQGWMDQFVDKEGNIRNYKLQDYNIDNVKNGKTLLMLYKVTRQEKYLKAVHLLYSQMEQHPRTNQGGFWHKKIYPYQMWLDGLYMAQPFLAEYADLIDKPELYDDIVNQFVYMEQHARDSKTGLLYHGWDESREQRWANPETGVSPHFWARGMGWYVMALVDVLDYFPERHPRRKELLAILNRTLDATVRYQDPKSGVWYDIVDLGHREGNYLEASASSMFVYGLAKSIRKGYVSQKYRKALEKAYAGLVNEFVSHAGEERIDLNKVVEVSGLGGTKNYRDGSFEYYMSEPVVTNDYKGVGPFMLAASEMELYTRPTNLKKRPVVTLDNYYNNEYKKSPSGKQEPYHYLWDGQDNNGFSFLGGVFERRGTVLHTLREAPSTKNLRKSSVYIIVDPDTEKETDSPNFMTTPQANAIAAWVRRGGVLVLLLNDVGNAEIAKFNALPQQFGITFNEDSRNKVTGRNFQMGALDIPTGHEIFKNTRKIYLKEISTLNVAPPARAVLQDKGDVIVAVAEYGKGKVFAVGDPWFYNEYVDGRKLPSELENFEAANDLVDWLLQKTHK